MTTYRASMYGIFAALLFTAAAFAFPAFANAQTATGTVTVTFEKKFSGDDRGFEAADFSFHVTGDHGVDAIVAHNGTLDLHPGSYAVSEVVPEGFDPDDWTIQWTGPRDICVNETAPEGTINVTEDDVVQLIDNVRCVADNQYKPDILGCTDPEAINYDPAADEDDGSCDYEDDDNGDGGNGDGATGTIIVEKEVTEGSNVETSFTFSGSWGGNFELADGQSTSSVFATGTYSVLETVPTDWDQVSAVCVHGDESTSTPESIDLDEDETVTCTFTNDEEEDDNGGGGGGNDDPVCEIDSDDLLVDDDDVFTLTWTSSGKVDRASINAGIGSVDANGSLETSVDNDTTFVLTVQTLGDEEEVVAESSCNVSVNERGGGNGGGGYPRGDDDDGGSGGGDDDDDDDGGTPDGEVLGEQIDIIPLGGAGTGAGGGAGSATVQVLTLLAIAFAALRQRTA